MQTVLMIYNYGLTSAYRMCDIDNRFIFLTKKKSEIFSRYAIKLSKHDTFYKDFRFINISFDVNV